MARHDAVDQRAHLVGPRHVGAHERAAVDRGLDDVGDDDARTGGDERERRRVSDAGRAAGDETDLSLERAHADLPTKPYARRLGVAPEIA